MYYELSLIVIFSSILLKFVFTFYNICTTHESTRKTYYFSPLMYLIVIESLQGVQKSFFPSSSLCLFSYIQYIKFLLYKTSLDLWLYNSIKSFRTYFTCLCVVVYTTQWWPFWEDCSQFVPTSVSDFRKIILSFAPTSQLAINKLQFYCWQ